MNATRLFSPFTSIPEAIALADALSLDAQAFSFEQQQDPYWRSGFLAALNAAWVNLPPEHPLAVLALYLPEDPRIRNVPRLAAFFHADGGDPFSYTGSRLQSALAGAACVWRFLAAQKSWSQSSQEVRHVV